jgi:hypothetical protein
MVRYLIGTGIFFIFWLLFYIHKKNLRKEMLIMSFLVAPLGPLSELFYFRDYWNPDYIFPIFGVGIEDLLFAFFIGGIGAVAYEELFIKKIRKTKRDQSKLLAIIGILSLFIFITLTLFFKMNSIYSSSIVFVLGGLIIVYKRKDLLKNAIGNGILVAMIMLLFYVIFTSIFPTVIEDWWQLHNLSGFFLGGAPIEEIIWGFCWGFLIGPLYEFWRGYKEIEYS